jgi:esterase/lipase superfamily enzyme
MSNQRILTITNRKPEKNNRFLFGDKRSETVSYARTSGWVTKNNLDMPEWLRFLASLHTPIAEMCWKRRSPKVHNIELRTEAQFWVDLEELCREADTDEVVVSLHGFNIDAENDKQRGLAHAKAREVYGGKAMPEITLDWACSSGVNYLKDSASARFARNFVVEAIYDIASRKKVHIVGFSMGNQILADALPALLGYDLQIESISFVSADVDREDFLLNIAPDAAALSQKVSVYISGHDKPLRSSEILHCAPRLGQLPLRPRSLFQKVITWITRKKIKAELDLIPQVSTVNWFVITELNDHFGHNEPFGALAVVASGAQRTKLAKQFCFEELRADVIEITPRD